MVGSEGENRMKTRKNDEIDKQYAIRPLRPGV